MVIHEAIALALPVLTVETTSSQEMVAQSGAGWVCPNDQQALNEALLDLLAHPEKIEKTRAFLTEQPVDNTAAAKQFYRLIEE